MRPPVETRCRLRETDESSVARQNIRLPLTLCSRSRQTPSILMFSLAVFISTAWSISLLLQYRFTCNGRCPWPTVCIVHSHILGGQFPLRYHSLVLFGSLLFGSLLFGLLTPFNHQTGLLKISLLSVHAKSWTTGTWLRPIYTRGSMLIAVSSGLFDHDGPESKECGGVCAKTPVRIEAHKKNRGHELCLGG